jgi:hypothetical protein
LGPRVLTPFYARRRKFSTNFPGVPISGENSRVLEIVLPEGQSIVFETPTGRVSYAILLRMVVLSPVTLTDWDLLTKYDTQIIPESLDERSDTYQVGGRKYLAREVLNQRIESGLALSRGQVVEGWLLGNGLRRLPIEQNNFPLAFDLVFVDQFGNEYRKDGDLLVSRSAKRYRLAGPPGRTLDGLDATTNRGRDKSR